LSEDAIDPCGHDALREPEDRDKMYPGFFWAAKKFWVAGVGVGAVAIGLIALFAPVCTENFVRID